MLLCVIPCVCVLYVDGLSCVLLCVDGCCVIIAVCRMLVCVLWCGMCCNAGRASGVGVRRCVLVCVALCCDVVYVVVILCRVTVCVVMCCCMQCYGGMRQCVVYVDG